MGLQCAKSGWLGMSAALVIVGAAGCDRTPPGPPPPPPADRLRVLDLVGEATLDGTRLTAEFVGTGGGLLRAAEGARLDLKVGDDTVWQILGPAEVRMEATPRRRHAELVAGRLGAAFRSGVTDVTMRVGAAVAGIRGTVMYAQRTSDVPDYTCVCEGRVEFRHDHGGFARVNSRGHDQPLRVMPQGFMPQPILGHGDADVAKLKALLAR